MGAVASAMAQKGITVTGSDHAAYPPMSDFLRKKGIHIFEGYSADNLPQEADLFVIGNAMSRGNPEVEALLSSGKRYMSLPEALKEHFLWQRRNFVVTGTHGKTTTSSLLTWLMKDNQLDPSFMIGGIAYNLSCGGHFTDSPFFVLEGDEYDTAFFDKRSKFLHYLPELLIINNIEMDHADIYKDVDEIKLSFTRLLRIVPIGGQILINADCPHCMDVAAQAPQGIALKTIGFSAHADYPITNVDYHTEGCRFDLEGHRYNIPMLGEFNVRNAAMAISAARYAGIDAEGIQQALSRFLGVARRQEVRGEVRGIKVIDDFAHHPTAMRHAITALRQANPDKRICVVFDPRSNTSSSNLFQHELAAALSTAEIAIVAPIERADKHAPDKLLNLALLQEEVSKQDCQCYLGKDVQDMVDYIARNAIEGDIVLVMSNGGFGNIHCKILEALK